MAQDGFVYKAFGAWHVKYRVPKERDGKVVRVLESHRLCDAIQTKGTAKDLARAHMQQVNALQGKGTEADMAVSGFWKQIYLPWLTKTKKASTLNGYTKLWAGHLQPHFVGISLHEYTCPQASAWLTTLSEKLGRRSVAHVRSLASGMFKHAKQLGRIKQNPFSDAGSFVKPKEPEATHAYSLEEAEAIFNALMDHPLAQLVFCLATFMGLRPGEIAGLKWSDIDDGWIHVRRAVWRGIEGKTKTADAVASIPLIEPVRTLFATWRAASADLQIISPAGWLFPNTRGNPMDLSAFVAREIVPVLEAKNLEWHGLYAGRRACATLLVQLTGNAVAAQYVLRHKNLSVTTAHYVKPVRDEAITGMQALEERVAEKFKPASVRLQPKALTAGGE